MQTCSTCGEELLTAKALRNHMATHLDKDSYLCPKCPAVFRLYSTLYDHKKVSHVPGGPSKCPHCPCRFAAKAGLQKHVEIYHKMVQELEFDEKQNAVSRKSRGKISRCPYCPEAFMTARALQQHVQDHTIEDQHATGGGSDLPEVDLEEAQSWTRSTNGVNMHKCGQCGKLLSTAAALRNHMFIHTGEKPWQCEKCPKAFRSYSTLCNHTKVSHMPGGKFKCPECPCRFTSQLGLKRHAGAHPRVDPEKVNHAQDALTGTNNAKSVKNSGRVMLHQAIKKRVPALSAVISEDGTRTYPCEYCHKVFNKSQNFRSHLRVHAGERNTVCNMCSVDFNSSSSLSAHKNVSHVEGGSHKCEKCPCVFASYLGLIRHKADHHDLFKEAKSTPEVKIPVQVDLEEQEGEEEEESDRIKSWEQNGNERADEVQQTEDKDDKATHTGEKPFVCNLCGASFGLKVTLCGHKHTSHVETGQYQCDKCCCKFTAECELKRHKISFHDDEGAAPQVVTEYPIAPAKALKIRDVTIKPTHGSSDDDEKLYLCDRCGKDFTTDASLNNHQLHCGQTDEADDTWSCRDLEVDWRDWKLQPSACKVVVQEIEQVVLDNLEQQGFVYVCPSTKDTDAGNQGPKVKFSFQKPVKQFVAIGDTARGQKCSNCSKFFRNSDDLKLHVEAVHIPSGKTLPSPTIIKLNQKFRCSLCDSSKLYSTRQGAEQHINRVHTASKSCPHCEGKFSSVSTLNRHIHTKHLKTKRQTGFRRTLTNVRCR